MADVDSATKVDIIGIKGNSPVPWATEDTLAKLLSTNKVSATALLDIGKKLKIDNDHLRDLVDIEAKRAKNEETNVIDAKSRAQKLTDSLDNGLRGVKNSISSALRFDGEQLSSPFRLAGNSLKDFSDQLKLKMPAWAKFLGVAGLGALVFSELFDVIEKQNTTLVKLYGNGLLVENGFSGLAKGAMAAGVSAYDLAERLNKYSNVAVALGTKRTTDLMGMFAQTTRYGADFAMSNKESQEALAETLDTMQSFGILKNKSDKEVLGFTKDYLANLNDLSEATGRNRDEVRKQLQEYSKTTTAFLTMQMLPKEVRENFAKAEASVLASFGKQGPRMLDEMGKYLTGGVGMMSKEYQLLFTGLGKGAGTVFADMANASARGDLKAMEAAKGKLIDMIGDMSPQQARQLQLYAKTNPAFAQLYTELTQASQAEKNRRERLASMSKEEREKEEAKSKAEKKALEDYTAATNEARVASLQLQTMFQKLIADVGPVLIPALQVFASAVKTVADAIVWLNDKIQKVLSTFGASPGTSTAVAAISTVAILVIIKQVIGALMSGAGGALINFVKKGVGIGGKSGGMTGLDTPGGIEGLKKSKGLGGFAKGAGGLLKGIAGGVGAAIGGLALDAATEKLQKSGHEKIGAATDIGSSALTGAGIGATIGSFIPVVGTAVGAAAGGIIGTLYGVYDNWNTLMDGTLEGMTTGITNFVSGIGTNISNGLSTIGDAIGGTFGKAKEMVSSAWDGIKGFMSGALQTTAAVSSSIGQSFVSGISGIGGFVTNMFSGVGDFITKARNNVTQGLTDMTSSFDQNKDVISNAWNSITSFMSSAAGKATAIGKKFLGTAFKSVTQGMADTLTTAAGISDKLLSGNLEDTVAGMTGLLNFAGDIGKKFIGGALDNVSKGVATTLDITKNLGTGTTAALAGVFAKTPLALGAFIGGKLTESWPAIKEGLAKVTDFIVDFTGNISEKVKDGYKGMTDFVGDFISGVGDKITNGLTWIGDNVTNTFNKAKDFITNTWDGIVTTISNTVGTLSGVSRDAVSWLSSLFSKSSSQPAATNQGPTTPVITTDQLNARTLKYYDDSIAKMLLMIDKLDVLHTDMDRLRETYDTGTGKMIDAYNRSGQLIK